MRMRGLHLISIWQSFLLVLHLRPTIPLLKRKIDAANCRTVFLSQSFVHEIYDGQLFIKLKKGFNFPAMDPWGTSDPYVVMQLDCQVVKSKVKWGTKEPTWNEEFSLNIKQPPEQNLQVVANCYGAFFYDQTNLVAAWDANVVTPHKRMGNTAVYLENLCDGNPHEVLLDLEGMGGGGKIQLEIKYKSFEIIDKEKKWWRIPFVTEFLEKKALEPALKMIVGSETVQARQFVQFAFGQIMSFNDSYLQKDWFSDDIDETKMENNSEGSSNETSQKEENVRSKPNPTSNSTADLFNSSPVSQVDKASQSDKHFWKKLADWVNRNVIHGRPAPEKIKWDRFELLNSIGLHLRKIAEAGYVESGLATPDNQEAANGNVSSGLISNNSIQTFLPDIKKATQDILRQTDSILGTLMVLNAAVSKLNKGAGLKGQSETNEDALQVQKDVSISTESKKLTSTPNGLVLDEGKAEEMRALFSTAESAMEAWAMLANAVGHPTFIRSEFEKISFLDNASTDTQVSLWRDPERRRLVVAFRGTEQSRWKDLRTDLMLVPAGLNPERIGGDFKQEVQVHSGFLSAYDSVRTRLILLIKQAVGYRDDLLELLPKWHICVTGHSLGGALATLLALELSSSQLAKQGAISVTMYNFGSPRVGNRRFAEVYNEKVKDSWRVVNHRDIIPTVPHLMGYCHVAQPVYLAAGEVESTMENMDLLEDGYRGDVIGEATPDVLVSEFD
ncbi:uncharacterized protein LOC111393637 isoform X3 [Olea europaea var. sylvestris]|uniref:uncharacterized protein LOC111393637 isoform X3 n=1 Tax=Olea europaea var. sylvestris TaxID=158386 RepID=UPI000C1CF2C2|nr:uncharacterized protein LOC111393637 isoform X3 [Olea europaea var. sylvestris]